MLDTGVRYFPVFSAENSQEDNDRALCAII